MKPPSPELPKVESAADFDRVLRGLLSVPVSAKPKRAKRMRRKSR